MRASVRKASFDPETSRWQLPQSGQAPRMQAKDARMPNKKASKHACMQNRVDETKVQGRNS